MDMNQYNTANQMTDSNVLVRKVMVRVYAWMTLALLISAVSGLFLMSNEALLFAIASTPLYWVLAIAEIVLVIVLSARAQRMSSFAAKSCFVAYAVLNGVTFGVIFYAYDLGTVSYAFLATALTFAVMSGYGYVTKADLSSIGNLFVMALFGLVIATIIGFFIPSPAYTRALMYVGIIIFVGLIGWDTQKIKNYAAMQNGSVGNIAILGALTLYLDFINIFIRLVRIMGRRD